MIKQLTFLTILLISNQVLADDCASQKTQSSCAGVTGCAYKVSGSSCTNNCNGLSQTDCTNNTNSSYCSYSQGGCINKTDCTTLTTSVTCGGNADCQFTPATGTCAVSGNSLETYCSSLVSSSSTCDSDPKCQYIAPSFTCSVNASQCATAIIDSNCNSDFCTITDRADPTNATACVVIAPMGDCPNLNNQQDCVNYYCSWSTDNKCYNYCASINSTFNANTDNGKCKLTGSCGLTYCAANQDKGNTNCGLLPDATTCGKQKYCTGITTAAQCIPKDTYCTYATKSNTCDSAYCAFTPTAGSHDICTNKFDCTSLLDSSSCGNNSKCTYNTPSCSNKNTSSCNNSDNEATCTGTGKFCTFSQQGSCTASEQTSTTSGSALSAVTIISSLILALAFL